MVSKVCDAGKSKLLVYPYARGLREVDPSEDSLSQCSRFQFRSALPKISQGVLRSMALSVACLAFGLSLVNEGRGSVEEPFQKRLNRLSVSRKGSITTGMKE